jgi:hypothetical protein
VCWFATIYVVIRVFVYLMLAMVEVSESALAAILGELRILTASNVAITHQYEAFRAEVVLPMLRRSSGACQLWNVLFIPPCHSIRHLAVLMLRHAPQLCPRSSRIHLASHLFLIFLHFPVSHLWRLRFTC